MKLLSSYSRSCALSGIVLGLTVIASGGLVYAANIEQQTDKTAGDVTVYANGLNAFSFPAANLPEAERTRFAIGNSFFRRNWVQAPASTAARDGLGPHFIARSCGGCHSQDGRGKPPVMLNGENRDQPVDLLIRLSIPGKDIHGGVKPDPVYGDQLDNFSITGVKAEGQVHIKQTPINGQYADGSPYVLNMPTYSIDQLGYGPLHKDIMLSPRIANQLIGVGLLEAIPEQDILDNVKVQSQRSDGIKGMPNRVWDEYTKSMMLGRFGWKANVATLAHQTAGAFRGDMGITTGIFPDEACTPTQTDCLAAPTGSKKGEPELPDKLFGNIVFYQSVLAPPARRNVDSAEVKRGQVLFQQLNCSVCHTPSYQTGQVPFPEFSSKALENQTIWPYTDLLLHDMGEGLADNRPDFKASGAQWKTPPLWGIGLFKDVNGHERLMHDGRADGVAQAILWHGGEAQASRNAFTALNANEREALAQFVESL